jgi:hypothetical protein
MANGPRPGHLPVTCLDFYVHHMKIALFGSVHPRYNLSSYMAHVQQKVTCEWSCSS